MTKQNTRTALSILSGAALLSVASVQAQSTNVLSVTTFDPEAPAAWGYGYFYPAAASASGTFEYQTSFYTPEDVDLTNGMWRYSFDSTALDGMTGYGTGTGGPLFMTDADPASFVSPRRQDYILTFDAKVEGLSEAQASANAQMELQFFHPDPNPEGTGQNVKLFQVNTPFNPTAQWQTFSFNLGQGNIGGDTIAEDFATHHATTTALQFNVNFHEPHNQFGFDAENTLLLDNMKLEVVATEAVAPLPTYTVPIADWNFDDKPVWYEFHYQWSQNEIQPVSTGGNNFNNENPNTVGKDGTSGWFLNLDTTEFNNDAPDWAGGGTGGSGPVDYTLFTSTNPADYQVTFDARVLGLNERTNTTAVVQLHMQAPDDTVGEPDENTDPDGFARLDVTIARVGTDWKTYTIPLGDAAFGNGTTLSNFQAYVLQTSNFTTQWQLENIGSIADWGYDAENSLIIDNFRLERIYSGLSAITATLNGDQLVLTWDETASGNVKLQSSTTVDGPYTDIPDATSGYTVPVTGTQRFFRLAQEEPAAGQ